MHLSRSACSLTALGVVTLLSVPTAASAAVLPDDPIELTLMSTTDVHGHVYDWDYFQNAPYPATSGLGLTRMATEIEDVRAERGAESVVVLDNGDAIQGTPLTYYYGLGAGAAGVLDGSIEHPMAQAFDTIGYDAQVVGNHEYNYGLDLLGAYEDDLDAPLLGANVLEAGTTEPYHEPYTLIERTIDGEDVTVGVIGLVTPGVRVWDKQNVEGVLEFQDMVEAAAEWVPVVDELADVVVVLAHTGQGSVSDADYAAADLNENVVNNIATQVPGIDVIVAGHTHQDLPGTVFTNTAGEKVLVTQPNFWARGLTEVTLGLVDDGAGGWAVDWSEGAAPVATPVYGRDIPVEDPDVVAALADEHRTTIDYVNTPVAQSTEELSAATSRYEDTAIIDFINQVQAETVEQALEGTEYAGLPVISQASPFSRDAVFPEGEVTIADIAGLYVFENTLRGVQLTGAQVREYLEYSARYFAQVAPGAVFDPATGTNAVYPGGSANGIPDYNYDMIAGLDYVIDVSQPVGQRISGLATASGTPVADTDVFVMAVNNYRQSGGGTYPAVATAPVVYDDRLEIRQLLIDWAGVRGVIDPAEFFEQNWTLVTSPVAGAPTPAPIVLPADAVPAPSASPVAATPAGVPASARPTSSRPGTLAATGQDATAVLLAGALLLAAGVGVRLALRRRSAAADRLGH